MTYSHEWMTIKLFSERYCWPSIAALRSYHYKAEQYGLSSAFKKIGKRVLVNPKLFFSILEKKKD